MEANELGTIRRAGNRFEARLERTLEHDQQAVWKMLTDSSLLPQWLAPGTLALSKGGTAKLNFPESGTNVESVVTAIDPPRLIEYSWSSPGEPDRPLRWEAVATPGGTRLSLNGAGGVAAPPHPGAHGATACETRCMRCAYYRDRLSLWSSLTRSASVFLLHLVDEPSGLPRARSRIGSLG